MGEKIFSIEENATMGEIPLFILVAVNVLIIFYMIAYLTKQKKNKLFPAEIINCLGILGLSWLAFAIVWGLILTFDVLESSGNSHVLTAFADGFAVAMRIMMVGLAIACIPLVTYLKLIPKRKLAAS